MENNRKRGRETWNATSYRRKRQIMTSMTLYDDDDVYQIGYEWENTKNFMGIEECYQDDESGAGAGARAGVFDFPWHKGSKDVSFDAEIDECLNSTFATPTPTTSFCNYYDDHEINIDTITTTTPLISCDNTFYRKNLLLQLDIDHDFNFDLDLIDQFFMDNSSSTTTQSSCDDDQLKVNKIEDQPLKIEVNGDDDQPEMNKIEDQQLKIEVNGNDDQPEVNKIEDRQLKIEVNDDDDQPKVNKIEDQQLKIEVNDDDDKLKVNKIEDQQFKTKVNDDDQLKVNKIEDQQLKTEVSDE